MRKLVRTVVDLDKPIQMKDLNWKEKLWVGFSSQWRNTKIYKYTDKKNKEAEYLKRLSMDENLRDLLLGQINSFLVGEECDAIYLEIKREYEESLKRVLKKPEFFIYRIEIIPENPDVRIAFPDMPILVKCSSMRITEVVS